MNILKFGSLLCIYLLILDATDSDSTSSTTNPQTTMSVPQTTTIRTTTRSASEKPIAEPTTNPQSKAPIHETTTIGKTTRSVSIPPITQPQPLQETTSITTTTPTGKITKKSESYLDHQLQELQHILQQALNEFGQINSSKLPADFEMEYFRSKLQSAFDIKIDELITDEEKLNAMTRKKEAVHNYYTYQDEKTHLNERLSDWISNMDKLIKDKNILPEKRSKFQEYRNKMEMVKQYGSLNSKRTALLEVYDKSLIEFLSKESIQTTRKPVSDEDEDSSEEGWLDYFYWILDYY